MQLLKVFTVATLFAAVAFAAEAPKPEAGKGKDDAAKASVIKADIAGCKDSSKDNKDKVNAAVEDLSKEPVLKALFTIKTTDAEVHDQALKSIKAAAKVEKIIKAKEGKTIPAPVTAAIKEVADLAEASTPEDIAKAVAKLLKVVNDVKAGANKEDFEYPENLTDTFFKILDKAMTDAKNMAAADKETLKNLMGGSSWFWPIVIGGIVVVVIVIAVALFFILRRK